MIDRREMGLRIWKRMTAKGYTARTLAERMGVKRESVYKWANGIAVPKTELLAELSEVLETSVDYLIFGERKERRNGDD